jgi:hypothetical protein
MAEYTTDVEPIPVLLGSAMRIDEVEALEPGTVLAAVPHYHPYPVEFLGVERKKQRRSAHRGPRLVRMARVRLLAGQVGAERLLEARELRGLWEPFIDRCRAEWAARQPLEDARTNVAAALAQVGIEAAVNQRMYTDHRQDRVVVDLTVTQVAQLVARLDPS